MKRFILHTFKTLLRKLHMAEHADFYESGVINPLIALMAALPMVSGVFNALRNVYQKEDVLFKQSMASSMTKGISFMHEKRFALYMYFWHTVNVSRYFDDIAMEQAAEDLQFLRNNYKGLSDANYSDASGLMTNFLEDCEKPEWAQLIQALGQTALIGKIRTAHETFKDMYRERSFDKEHIAQVGKLREIRLEVDDTFEALVEGINAAWLANEYGAKDPTVRANLIEAREHITAAIHQAELNLTRRGHHKKDDGKKDDNKTDTPTQTPDTTNPPAPNTPPQTPDTSNPAAPDTPNQNPGTGPHPLDPNEHPSMGEH